MKQNTGQRDTEHKIQTQPSGNMEDNTMNCTGYEENTPKVSESEENGNLDVFGLAEDMTSTENNDKKFTTECTDKLQNCIQDSPAHETYSKKTGVDDSTSKIESACILPSTHTESVCVIPNTHIEAACIMPSIHIESACTMPNTHIEAACIIPSIHIESACTMPNIHIEAACIMSNTQRDAVEWTQMDSDPEISKDSFQTYDNFEQKPACDNTHTSRNKCNVRNMKSPNLSNVSTPQNSSQYSGLVIVNKDLLKLFSPSPPLSDPPCMIFPTSNLYNTTCKSPVTVNNRNKKFAQTTEKEEHNLEKEVFSVILLQGIANETKKEPEHGKKTCKKHVTFSSSLTKPTEDSLETNSSKSSEDELLMENINTSLQDDNITDSIMGRFTHGFLSVIAHMYNFAFSRFSSAISEAWEATTTAHKDGYVKYDGPKPRPSLRSHFNRMASKRRLLPSYADETESEMKIVKRSCQVSLIQSNHIEKLYASSETRFGSS